MTEDKTEKTQSTELKFPLGIVVITQGAGGKLSQYDIYSALNRHRRGDWGNVDPSDWNRNDEARSGGSRILSVYESSDGLTFWIITEANRSSTTVSIPEEY